MSLFNQLVSTGGSAATGNVFGTVSSLGKLLGGVFQGKKPNPNDWMGWTYGDAKKWVAEDGDSISNEAVNVYSFMSKPDFDISHMFDDSFGYRAVTEDMIRSKLRRGGFSFDSTTSFQPEPTSSFFSAANANGGIVPNKGGFFSPKKEFPWWIFLMILCPLVPVLFFYDFKRKQWKSN